jgi:hypothetical protein
LHRHYENESPKKHSHKKHPAFSRVCPITVKLEIPPPLFLE